MGDQDKSCREALKRLRKQLARLQEVMRQADERHLAWAERMGLTEEER